MGSVDKGTGLLLSLHHPWLKDVHLAAMALRPKCFGVSDRKRVPFWFVGCGSEPRCADTVGAS